MKETCSQEDPTVGLRPILNTNGHLVTFEEGEEHQFRLTARRALSSVSERRASAFELR